MNKKQYMWARLAMPIIVFIIGTILGDKMLLGFAVGYFLCWTFSWNLIDKDTKGRVTE